MKMKMRMRMKMMIMIMKMKMKTEQWIKTKKNEIIKGENDNFDEIIDKSRSFKEQIANRIVKKIRRFKRALAL